MKENLMEKGKPSMTIDPALKKELITVNATLAKLPKRVTTDKEYAYVETANKLASAFIKQVKAAKDKVEKPLKEAIAALKATYQPLLDPAEAILAATKPLISAWAFEKEKEAERVAEAERKRLLTEAKQEKKAAIEELRESGNKSEARALAAVPVIVPEVIVENKAICDDLSFRVDVIVEVVDINLVPDEYVNKTLRLADVKSAWKLDHSLRVPGLKLSETRTSVRS
jgi:hypothetical protein